MKDFIFILLTLSAVSGAIYFVYLLMLGSSKPTRDDLQVNADDLLEQINMLYHQKKYHIVECMAKKYLERKPKDDSIRAVLTKSLFNNGKISEAIEQAKVIIHHQPGNNDIKLILADYYLKTMKPQLAIGILNEILEKDPTNVTALTEIAKIYLSTNQKKAAIGVLNNLAPLAFTNQEKVEIKSTLAQLHIDFKEYDLAIEEYEGILEIYPVDADVKVQLIKLYQLQSNWMLTISAATELLDMHIDEEKDLWALQTLTDAYTQIGDFENAMECAKAASENPNANSVQATQKIASILMNIDEIDKSIEILSKLLEENPDDIEIKKSLAASYEAKKDFNAAANLYKKILDDVGADELIQIHFEMSCLYTHWAMHLFKENDNVECFKKFTIALQYDSSNPEIYYQLGIINQSIKNFNEAISQYKKAIERNSTNYLYYSSIAECYKEIDNLYEEKRSLLECLKYNDKDPNAHYRLALIYSSQNDVGNAVAEMKKAIALNDSFVDAKYHLALLLELKDEKDAAIELYNQILAIKPDYTEAINNLKMLKP